MITRTPAGISIESFSGDRDLQRAVASSRDGDVPEDLAGIHDYYVEPGGNFWIAQTKAPRYLAGFVGLRRNAPQEAELKRLTVLREFWGQGIGRTLVGTAVEWADAQEITRVTVTTGLREEGHPAYEQFDFVVTAVLEEQAQVRMERQI